MRGISGLRICLMAFVALLTAARAAPAQVTTGFITGTVQDGQGGVIPGATVTLISEARGTRSAPTVTGPSGDFVFPNVSVDTYTIEVAMASFKTLRRPGVAVSAGIAGRGRSPDHRGRRRGRDRGGQGRGAGHPGGERRAIVHDSDRVRPEPPARQPQLHRAGAAGARRHRHRRRSARAANMSTNFTMDGISTMDTGSNTVMLQMNTESIAEVKLLVSGYQAEYGRSSGLQVMAVTKSGTNRFRGSFYDVERNSDWDANSKTNNLNGLPKTVSKQRDIGYSIGGPIGKPGGNNKLFFFNAVEFRPRTGGNDLQTFRVPTALERAGDFSQTLDNNGKLYPYIKDPLLSGACNATSQAACFADGGVLGRIPQDRLYQPGLNILKMWPMPTGSQIIGTNLEFIRPAEETLSYQPAVRFDYQALAGVARQLQVPGADHPAARSTRAPSPGWNNTLTPLPASARMPCRSTTTSTRRRSSRARSGARGTSRAAIRSIRIADARSGGAGGPSAPLPGRQRHQSRLLRLRALNRASPRRRTGTARGSTRHRTSAGAIGLPVATATGRPTSG